MPHPHPVQIFINRAKYELASPEQTGLGLKELAHIPPGDVLFLQKHGEDVVVPNDRTVELHDGDHLHSQPPADYGALSFDASELGPEVRFDAVPQAEGWTFLVVHDWPVPAAYEPRVVKLLVKLPPLFPEAQPDMFWVSPDVRTQNGQAPHGTSAEVVNGESWQRFSWHLKPGAWNPGTSTLGDYMRAVKARFERGN